MTLTVCQQYWPLSSFKSAPEAAPSQFSDIWCMPAGFTNSRTKFSVKALSRWFRRDQYLVGDGFGAPKLMASAKDNKFHALDLNLNRPRLPPTFPKPRDAPASVWHPTTKIAIEERPLVHHAKRQAGQTGTRVLYGSSLYNSIGRTSGYAWLEISSSRLHLSLRLFHTYPAIFALV